MVQYVLLKMEKRNVYVVKPVRGSTAQFVELMVKRTTTFVC